MKEVLVKNKDQEILERENRELKARVKQIEEHLAQVKEINREQKEYIQSIRKQGGLPKDGQIQMVTHPDQTF